MKYVGGQLVRLMAKLLGSAYFAEYQGSHNEPVEHNNLHIFNSLKWEEQLLHIEAELSPHVGAEQYLKLT